MKTIRAALIEDDAEIRQNVQQYFQSQTHIECTVAAESVEGFLQRVEKCEPPDVALLDIGLPGISGIRGIALIKDRLPQLDIIMFTVYDDAQKIFDSLCAGASGYLLKTTSFRKISEAIEHVHAGWAAMSPAIAHKVAAYFTAKHGRTSMPSPLTAREKEIVAGLVDGLSYKMIADRLSITIETVRQHIKNIYRKLHVNCKAEVIARSLRGEI